MLKFPSGVEKYALAQRTEVKTLDDYGDLIEEEAGLIAPWLVKGDALEIGCGIGAMAVFIARHCRGEMHLLDGTGWSEKQAGWWKSNEAWNDTDLTTRVLNENGVDVASFSAIGAKDLPQVDNVVSLLSWGWHYPVATYLDQVRGSLRPGGRLIIDLRDNRPQERALLAKHFDYVGDIQRHWRPGARTVWQAREKRQKPVPERKFTEANGDDPLQVVLWKWGSKFSADHVNRMRSMLARHLNMPHEIVCITDDSAGIDPTIRTVPLWEDLRSAGKCTVRLKAFHPSMAEVIGRRFAWIDLDCVIVDDVTEMFSRREDFVISGVELLPQPYNGSIVLMDAGARSQVFDTFDPMRLETERRRLNYGGSDQAWIAICLGPDEATWTESDGVFTYRDYIDPHPRMRTTRPLRPMMEGPRTNGGLPNGSRVIVFNGARYDPTDQRCRRMSPWIDEHWQ